MFDICISYISLQLIERSDHPNSSHADIIKEIEEMKKEKLEQHKKISELLDKLDESVIV